MNSELKSIIKLICDGALAIQSSVNKENFMSSLMPKIMQVTFDIPTVIQGISNLNAELAQLSASQQQQDVLDYIIQQFSGVTTQVHAKSILVASVNLIFSGVALQQAIMVAPTPTA